MLKISAISQVRSEIADIFNTFNEIFVVFTEKKINFLSIVSVKEKKLFSSHFAIILPGTAGLLGKTLGVNTVCT